jgi:hypothetical protein
LLLRTGSKPSRITYPCQQAAASAASLVFGAALIGVLVAIRRSRSGAWLTLAGMVLIIVSLLAVSGGGGRLPRAASNPIADLEAPADYRAQVFHQSDCPQDPVGDRFTCVEDLIEKMGAHGLKLHRSATTSLTAGPEGIIGADDVVILKINYQWPRRGGTNTDLLRGLIRRIVAHPDAFTGEIVICENTQTQSSDNYDREENNAQDYGLSPRDVVLHFQSLGYDISIYDWTTLRLVSVGEYSDGDMNDGYVVYPYQSELHGRVSYPKFQTALGTRISLKHGVWTEATGYDRERLKFINLPVLKSHHAVYGATAMIKNYMGVVTRELATNSHNAIHYGILGAVLGEIRPADLNILDAIWVNADPYSGPGTSYQVATRKDELVASADPVAGDLWAVKNILIPAFAANGYLPPWPYPSADPDDPSSKFRQYLDNSLTRILAAGYTATNDMNQIDGIELGPPGETSDPTGPGAPFLISKGPDGYEMSWSAPVRGAPPDDYLLYRTSLLGPSGIVDPQCEAWLGSGHSATLSTMADNHGFIVVARNAAGDGTFGRDDEGRDRPGPATEGVCP